MPILTGRERTVEIAAAAEANFLHGTTDGKYASQAAGWGCQIAPSFNDIGPGLDVTQTFDPAYGDAGEVEVTTTFTVRLRAGLLVPWDDVTFVGPEEVQALAIITTVPAGYTWANYLTDYTPNQVWSEWDASGALTATLLMKETDEDDLGTYYTRGELVGEDSTVAVAVAGTVTCSYQVGLGGTIHTISANIALAHTETCPADTAVDRFGTSVNGGAGFWGHKLQLQANAAEVSASFLAEGGGVQYAGRDIGGASGYAILTGTPNDATLAMTEHTDYGARVNIHNSPDWRYEFRAGVYDYQTGGSKVVPLQLRYDHVAGSELVQEWSTPTVSYFPPEVEAAERWRAYLLVSDFWDGVVAPSGLPGGGSSPGEGPIDPGGGTGTEHPYLTLIDERFGIHHCGALSGSQPAAGPWVHTQLAWGDAQGQLLDSKANLLGWGWRCCPSFTVATLTVDDVHRYRWSTDDTRWVAGTGGSVADDAGAVKLTADAVLATGFVPEIGAGGTDQPFYCAGYRYLRLRLKADAACTLTFELSRTVPGPITYTWTWEIAVGTSYALHEVDLAFPDTVSPGTLFPYDVELINGATIRVEVPAGRIGYLEYVEGYHQTSGSRIPLLIAAPGQSTAETSGIGGDDPPDPPAYLGWREANRWGRLFNNGALTLSLEGQLELDLIRPVLDTAFWADVRDTWSDDGVDLDTGLTVTLGSANGYDDLAREHLPTSGQRPWSEVTPGSGYAVKAIQRLPISGYYGMGDPTTEVYDPTLTFRSEKVLGGEINGLSYHSSAPTPGAVVTAYDDDTEAQQQGATSNADAFYRLFGRYGVVQPYDNSGNALWTGSFPNEAYTALGLRFNAWWLKASSGDPVDVDGYLIDEPLDPTVRGRFPILDRNQTIRHLDAQGPTGGVCVLQTRWGELYVGYAAADGIHVRRAPQPHPPFETDVLATDDATDDHPCLTRALGDPDGPERLWLIFQRGAADVYECYSDDDGEHWSSPTMEFTGGVYPRSRVFRRDGRRILAAIVSGVIEAKLRWPDGTEESFTFKDLAGVDLAVEEESWDLDWAVESEDRLQMLVRLSGDTAHTTLESADDGQHWEPN